MKIEEFYNQTLTGDKVELRKYDIVELVESNDWLDQNTWLHVGHKFQIVEVETTEVDEEVLQMVYCRPMFDFFMKGYYGSTQDGTIEILPDQLRLLERHDSFIVSNVIYQVD